VGTNHPDTCIPCSVRKDRLSCAVVVVDLIAVPLGRIVRVPVSCDQ